MLKRNYTQAQEDLILARKLIENEAHWCRFYAENAGRHCVIGALQEILRGNSIEIQNTRFDAAVRLLTGLDNLGAGIGKIMVVNDERGHAAALAMIDKAIGI